jgi:hypothetical protein
MKKTIISHSNTILLFVALLACIPLIFENAFQYSVPMGYAGLFTQMSEQISNANFVLPMGTPYYGPGGIPFAYPPFGLYLFSFFIKITGKIYFYLHWAPPIFTLFSLIPLYYLSIELFHSSVVGAVTIIIAATSQDLYVSHSWAAGIVRAPAFIFALLAICFYHRYRNKPSEKLIFFPGIFLGLAILSHLTYGLFVLVWIAFWTLASPTIVRIRVAILSFATGFILASIWIIPVVSRYGLQVFLHVLNSHGNGGSLPIPNDFSMLVKLFIQNIAPVSSHPLIAGLVVLGAFILIVRKEFTFLLLFFIIILAFPENARFVFLLGSMISGLGLSFAAAQFSRIPLERIKVPPGISNTLLLLPVLGYIWWSGYAVIRKYSPRIESATFDLAENIQDNFSKNGKYLALVVQDEAEWLPYLFQREPLVSQWGSEWLGTYNQQTHLMALYRDCQRQQDWSCVEDINDRTNNHPAGVITYVRDKQLNEQLANTIQWEQAYANRRYMVWLRVN